MLHGDGEMDFVRELLKSTFMMIGHPMWQSLADVK